ncbi:uncharacterized protein CC84DRAFT_1234277 [Paraphaeosphaeria sporulosa]|uniref:Uncharacterized protein n=1 Tax=Paraphaeosphaeria sporulosa TaxID=1460663 RepID=A0A177BVB7_9PLEO|nr:uncharacterized protein CC84DRAFT_1234277 [Paraphaeosphaeria sporulosa]OAF98671.1 hypothetical protein CC84DRAFT_1234277 [Paraphaeosphaeria sporulosa]
MRKLLGTSGTRKHIKLANSYYSKDAPEIQIAKVLEGQKNMNGGHDLKNWSLSARKVLKGGCSAAILVLKGHGRDEQPWSYDAPKLAMIVTSPVIRDYFIQNPESTDFPAINPQFKAKAIESVAHWLRILITVPELDNIRLPKLDPKMSVADLKDSLNMLGPEWNAFIGDFRNLMLAQAMKLTEARSLDKVKERKERNKVKKEKHSKEDLVVKEEKIEGAETAMKDKDTKETEQVVKH